MDKYATWSIRSAQCTLAKIEIAVVDWHCIEVVYNRHNIVKCRLSTGAVFCEA